MVYADVISVETARGSVQGQLGFTEALSPQLCVNQTRFGSSSPELITQLCLSWCTAECVVCLLCHILGRQYGHPEVTSVQNLSPEPQLCTEQEWPVQCPHHASPRGELLPDHPTSSFVSAAQLNLNKLPWASRFGCVWHICHQYVTLLCLQKEQWGCLEHIYFWKMCLPLGLAHALSLCTKIRIVKDVVSCSLKGRFSWDWWHWL